MFVDVARIPFLLHLGVAYFHIKLVRYTLLMWLPFYMSSELGCVARQRTRRPVSLALALSAPCKCSAATQRRVHRSTRSHTLALSNRSTVFVICSACPSPHAPLSPRSYGASDAGYMSTLFDVGATAGAIAGGVLSDSLFGGQRVTASLPAIALAALLVGNFNAIARGGAQAIGTAMAVLGFLIAIPDTSLGGVATQDVCERNGNGGAVLATALSLTNGIGAMGPILQGFLTPILVARFGWSGVFTAMAALCVVSLLVLLPAARDERRVRRTR